MIRVHVYDHRNKLISFLDTDKQEIIVGRSSKADIIVPDFKMDLVEFKITKDANNRLLLEHGKAATWFAGEKSFKVKSYLVVVTDLDFFSETGQAPPLEQPESLFSLKVVGVLVLALVIYTDLVVDPEASLLDTSRDLVLTFVTLGIFSSLLSVLSRVVNGEYNFIKISSSILQMMLILAIFALQGFGIRWLLPEIFRYDIVWGMFALGLAGFSYRKLIFLTFESFSERTKKVLCVFPAVLIGVTLLLLYFPFQPKYKHLSVSLRPPLFEMFEFNSKDHAQAMADFEHFIK